MLKKEQIQDSITYVLIICLFILAAIIIKPVIISIIYGLLLAYIFYPIYLIIKSKLKNKNLSAFLVCLGVLIIIIGIAIIALSSLLKEIVNFYLVIQKTDFMLIIESIIPEFLSSSQTSTTIVNAINSSISNILESFLQKISKIIINIPILLLQLFVVIFIFFFALRDGKKAVEYIKVISPIKKENHEKFFSHLKDITNSVLLGQILVGIFQGIIAGFGYYIFGVPNALLLTFLTIIIGVIPLIGPWFVWIPVDIYLFSTGRNIAGIGLLIYGIFLINFIDAFIRPLIVSKKTKINTAIIIIGMIGGIFTFGIIGLILGPLILAYILLVIELYMEKKITPKNSLLFKEQ